MARVASALERLAPRPRRGVLYVQYTNPAEYPPLEHSSRILARAGWEVLFLGTASRAGSALRFPPHERIAVRQLPFCPGGWRQKLHYALFAAWVLAWALRWRPVWVYASDSLSCPVALALALLPGAGTIYHEHDAPGDAPASLFARVCRATRARLARRAALCILPNERRAALFTAETGARRTVQCVWNCPAGEEVGAPRADPAPAGLLVFFHGSIGPDRLPLAVITALARLPEAVRLQVVGYETAGHAGYIRRLRDAAARLGVAPRLELVQLVPTRPELLERCGRADVGLALMPRSSPDINLRHMVGASNKAFDYLARGLAVVVSDLPDWRAAYVDPGYALACDPGDPASIAAALGWLLEHPAERWAMGERGRQRVASEWNYERQFARAYQRLDGR